MVEEQAGRGRGQGRAPGHGSGRSRGRGAGGGRGGRGGRRGFSGSLMDLPNAGQPQPQQSGNGKGKGRPKDGAGAAAASHQDGAGDDSAPASAAAAASASSSSKNSDATQSASQDEAADGEICFICAEPIKFYSLAQCNHRTCHVCAVRLRALYKKRECTFCKAPSDALIFTTNPDMEFLSFHANEIPYRDERLNIYFETQQARDETLILLHFNCPEEHCEYAASNWADLRGHARSEHGRLFCDLCTKHSRIFVHEHTLHTTSELTQHIRQAHNHCEFCKLNFYSDEELYVHMRDRHEQCFICKRYDETRDEYHRDYPALERHFRKKHFLCDAKECLEQKFVVFESDLDFKAHQVAEHGGELSSREKREALRVTANFHYNQNSTQGRSGQGTSASSGLTPRGRPRDDLHAEEGSDAARNDPLGLSILASRNHVPGSGGPANHQSRRAMFGSQLSGNNKKKGERDGVEIAGGESGEAASHARVQRHQEYMARVSELLGQSESRMHAFRSHVKMYHAGETSASDLVDALRSIVADQGKMVAVVNGLVDLLEDREQKHDVMTAWTALQVEQTHFPSLSGGNGANGSVGGSGAANGRSYANANANLSTAQRGQVRGVKNNATANSRSVWANVERAAASSGGHGGAGSRSSRQGPASSAARAAPSSSNFPSLGPSSSGKSGQVPGSVSHSARATAASRAGVTPWAGSSLSARSSGTASPLPVAARPFSVDVAPDSKRSNQTSVRSNASAFPTLPTNAAAAQLAAQKRALFEHRRQQGGGGGNTGSRTPAGQAGGSGSATPRAAWNAANVGRVDAGRGELDDDYLDDYLAERQSELNIDALAGRLHDAAAAQSFGPGTATAPSGAAPSGAPKGKKGKQKQVLVSMGGVHRG